MYLHEPELHIEIENIPSNDIMIWLWLVNTKFSNEQLWNFYFSKSNESKFKILRDMMINVYEWSSSWLSELQPCLFTGTMLYSCMMFWLWFWINHIEFFLHDKSLHHHDCLTLGQYVLFQHSNILTMYYNRPIWYSKVK